MRVSGGQSCENEVACKITGDILRVNVICIERLFSGLTVETLETTLKYLQLTKVCTILEEIVCTETFFCRSSLMH